jgi:hypothetical protein
LSNSFFSPNNYENPVNITFENEFDYSIIPGYTMTKEMKVRVNEADDFTDRWYEFGSNIYEYYNVETVKENLAVESTSETIMTIILSLDYKYTKTERKVYTVYNMLGKVGGFMGLIISAGAIFANIFSYKIYMMTMLSYFYKIDHDNPQHEDVIENAKIQRRSTHITPPIETGDRNFRPGNSEEEKDPPNNLETPPSSYVTLRKSSHHF